MKLALPLALVLAGCSGGQMVQYKESPERPFLDERFASAMNQIETALKFEHQNRQELREIKPGLKVGLDAVRRGNIRALAETYATNRVKYLKYFDPVPFEQMKKSVDELEKLAVLSQYVVETNTAAKTEE